MITKSNEIEDPHNYRKVNSKLDYYVTNSNNGGGGQYQCAAAVDGSVEIDGSRASTFASSQV